MVRNRYNRSQIAKLCDEGLTCHEIAGKVGGSWRTIYDILLDMGKVGVPRNSILDIQKVKALAKAGWTAEQIEYEFGWRFGIDQIREAMR